MKRMHFGLTGNIGSGKSTAGYIFQALGVPIYNSDKRAKSILHKNNKVKKQVISLIGSRAYRKNGKLDRKYVARVIFENKKMLDLINKIVHPAVREDYLSWRIKQKSAYTIQESALIFETSGEKYLDGTILVYAPNKLLIDRVKKRDHKSTKEVIKILDNQMDQEEKRARSSYIINNGLGDSFILQIQKIHLDILSRRKID